MRFDSVAIPTSCWRDEKKKKNKTKFQKKKMRKPFSIMWKGCGRVHSDKYLWLIETEILFIIDWDRMSCNRRDSFPICLHFQHQTVDSISNSTNSFHSRCDTWFLFSYRDNDSGHLFDNFPHFKCMKGKENKFTRRFSRCSDENHWIKISHHHSSVKIISLTISLATESN